MVILENNYILNRKMVGIAFLFNINYYCNVNAQVNGSMSQSNSSEINLLNSNDPKTGQFIKLLNTILSEFNITIGQTKVITDAVNNDSIVIPNGSIIIMGPIIVPERHIVVETNFSQIRYAVNNDSIVIPNGSIIITPGERITQSLVPGDLIMATILIIIQ